MTKGVPFVAYVFNMSEKIHSDDKREQRDSKVKKNWLVIVCLCDEDE